MNWYQRWLAQESQSASQTRLGWASTSLDGDMSFVERNVPVPAGPGLGTTPDYPDRQPARPSMYNHRRRKRRKPRGALPLTDPRTLLRSEQALPNSGVVQQPNDLTRI